MLVNDTKNLPGKKAKIEWQWAPYDAAKMIVGVYYYVLLFIYVYVYFIIICELMFFRHLFGHEKVYPCHM